MSNKYRDLFLSLKKTIFNSSSSQNYDEQEFEKLFKDAVGDYIDENPVDNSDSNQQQESVEIYISDTYTVINAARLASELIPGVTYNVTDRRLFFKAISTSEFEIDGTRQMYCPATYASGSNGGNTWLGVWNVDVEAYTGETIWLYAGGAK